MTRVAQLVFIVLTLMSPAVALAGPAEEANAMPRIAAMTQKSASADAQSALSVDHPKIFAFAPRDLKAVHKMVLLRTALWAWCLNPSAARRTKALQVKPYPRPRAAIGCGPL